MPSESVKPGNTFLDLDAPRAPREIFAVVGANAPANSDGVADGQAFAVVVCEDMKNDQNQMKSG